ncbi:THUMP domain-containing protein 1-like isoform X1 [Dinothrombium tinctorium]|uniref:THUMP domain-containing protein 1-like isoform X1 n=1 Tax=Dinothrombium tinctorium TaxID=1965070 RepID=A0A3S3P6G9_9ACAR|nr:THUMP domain-containing protein 1-like isoform X1 [Dinothrombium tinctorium]
MSAAESGSKAKRKKRQFYSKFEKQRKTNELKSGVKGFLCTCNMNEAECVREAYNLLDEYYEKVYCKQELDSSVSHKLDCDLEKEIAGLKAKPRSFRQLFVNCRNVVFIEVNDEIDPISIANCAFDEIEREKIAKTRFLLRFIPVSKTTKSDVKSIQECTKELLQDQSNDSISYMVVCKVRNNDNLSRSQLIEAVANVVKEQKPNWKVNFANPSITINVDVIWKTTCLSFLNDFDKRRKYNIVEFSQKIINEN